MFANGGFGQEWTKFSSKKKYSIEEKDMKENNAFFDKFD